MKSGELQKRRASIIHKRMTWKAKWWPIIPIKKVRHSIDVDFNGEIGERVGSWKGGCTGCGYEMKPNESPMETLFRMERERRFD